MHRPRTLYPLLSLVLTSCLTLALVGCGDDADMAHKGPYYTPPPSNPTSDQQEANKGDKYVAVGTNPFVVVAHDPLSTFAADVDTASYDIFRRDIELGRLPHKDSVRLEEYVNYFPYSYSAPPADSKTPFSITLRAAPSPASPTTVMAVGIKGRVVEEDKVKKPANLVFLIDVSGSMTSSTKLPLVKKVLLETLEVLDPSDTVSIVSYAGNTSVRLEPTPVAQAGKIKDVIDGLSSGGSTNGAGGIHLAYAQAEKGFIEGGINHVLLCTDGDFNVGVSSTAGLVSLIEEKRKTGITLTVLGFGYGNLNDAMMEAITNAGNGVYGVISSEDQAVKYVHTRLLSTMTFIAKDVKIQVEFNPEHVFAYRLLGYENRDIPDDQFRDDALDAGEIGSGHTVTALYELVMVGQSIPQPEGAPPVQDGAPATDPSRVLPEELCRVRIRYKEVEANEQDPAFEVARGLRAGDVLSACSQGSADFQWAVAIAAFAEILKQSPYARPEALPAIAKIVSAAAGTDGDRLEFVELFKTAQTLLTQ